MFYREVTQELLLFGLYKWVILAAIERKVEGTNTSFSEGRLWGSERERE